MSVVAKQDAKGRPYYIDSETGKRVAAPKESISSTKTPNIQMSDLTQDRALPGTAGLIAKGYKNYQAIQGPAFGGSYRGAFAGIVGSSLHFLAIFNDGSGNFAVFVPKSKLTQSPYFMPSDYADMFVETADASLTLGDDYGVTGKRVTSIVTADLTTPFNDCNALGPGVAILNTSAGKFFRSTKVVNGAYEKPFGYSPAGAAQTTAITEALSNDTPTTTATTTGGTSTANEGAGTKLWNWVKKNAVTLIVISVGVGVGIYLLSKRK